MGSSNGPNPWRHAGMGLELAGAAIICGLIGWFIGGETGMLIGGGIGFVGSFYLFIKEALGANREPPKSRKR